jgi:predicted transcriptional regulator
MKSVLISIQPKQCELIASGKKTVEVRKTKPKLDTHFKVYIYATKSGDRLVLKNDKVFEISKAITGKVIGEFVCDSVKMSFVGYNEKGCPSYWDILDGSCLTPNELVCYGEWKTLYGWHISNLVIYDKPKELSEFRIKCKGGCDIPYLYSPPCENCRKDRLTRPPQSWCYVESEVTE